MAFAAIAVLSFVFLSSFTVVRGEGIIINIEDLDDTWLAETFIDEDGDGINNEQWQFDFAAPAAVQGIQWNQLIGWVGANEAQQVLLQQAPGQPPTPDAAPEKPATAPDSKADAPATEDKPKPEPIDPRIIRLHLNDGSIISGKLGITTLAIDTRFGRLNVPIEQIRYIKPGIDSRPKLKEQVQGWIDQLASTNVEERKAASGQLAKLGASVLELLRPLVHDASASRAAEARAIIEKISEELDMEMLDPTDLSSQDVIATNAFTITGRIVPQSFALDSDFGNLTMALADVIKADRDGGEPEEERKSLSVDQTNFVSRTMKSTGLRVVKGDRITIRATGQLSMTRWGNAVATPDGASNTGWYLNGKIYNGALCLRIGSSGQITKVGNSLTITATESGILHLGIAMNPRYASDGYQYPGEFKADVRVKKK